MDKIKKILKKYKVIFLIVAIILSGILIGCLLLKINNEKVKCKPIDKNYKIIFVSNSDMNVDSIDVCNKCKKIKELPILTQENKVFDGWYYDSLFTEKVDINKIKENGLFDGNKCIIAYKDITLYAKWIETTSDVEIELNKEEKENATTNNTASDKNNSSNNKNNQVTNNTENGVVDKLSEKDYSKPEYSSVLIAELKCTTKWKEFGDGTSTCEQIAYCDDGYELKNGGCEKYADSYIEYIYYCADDEFDSTLKKCVVSKDAKEKCNIIGSPYELNNGKCYSGYLPYVTPEQCPANHLLRNECYSSVTEPDIICNSDMKYDPNLKKCIKYTEPHTTELKKCPNGYEMNIDGICVEHKLPKYKSAMTYECPKGYTLKWENERAMCYYSK